MCASWLWGQSHADVGRILGKLMNSSQPCKRQTLLLGTCTPAVPLLVGHVSHARWPLLYPVHKPSAQPACRFTALTSLVWPQAGTAGINSDSAEEDAWSPCCASPQAAPPSPTYAPVGPECKAAVNLLAMSVRPAHKAAVSHHGRSSQASDDQVWLAAAVRFKRLMAQGGFRGR